MRLYKIILILFIACFLNMEVLGTQDVIIDRADLSKFSISFSNLNNELDIFNNILFNDIKEAEETELNEKRRIKKVRKGFSPPQLLRFISRQQSSYVVSYKKIKSVSEFQHDYSHKLRSIISLL